MRKSLRKIKTTLEYVKINNTEKKINDKEINNA